MFSTDPIYSTSDLCKINPKNPGCGGGGNGNGGGNGKGNDGGANGNGENGGGNGSGGNQVPILDPTNGSADDGGNSGEGGDVNAGSGGNGGGGNGNGGGSTGPDYSAEGIAKRKAALIAAISKNVPGLELTPDDLVPISV